MVKALCIWKEKSVSVVHAELEFASVVCTETYPRYYDTKGIYLVAIIFIWKVDF